jgi:hypothetical protein
MVRDTGLEPVTPTVSRWCSTTELTALAVACGREDIRKLGGMAMFFFNFFDLLFSQIKSVENDPLTKFFGKW